MGSLLYSSLLKCLLFLVLLHLFLIQCSSSMQPKPLCRDYERSSLLQLKESFILNKSASGDPLAYPKVRSWKLEGESGGDCCSWDGVECDHKTGHVIGLDLSSSFLYGSIHSNSTLFHLVHLRSLNLFDNDFNYSGIPPAIGNLSRLSHLNLSYSVFSAQIPSQVLELSKLVTLDLSGNYLELHNPNLKSLAEKLVNLRHLNLDGVNVSSTIPQCLANFSSLTYLSLSNCDLHGEFPVKLFHLPYLQLLKVSDNPYLTGHLPQFQKNTSSIESLMLADTSFTGVLPKSIGNLKSLSHFSVAHCQFSGPIPSSFANLTQLNFLSLRDNGFNRGTLSWLDKLPELTLLDLSFTNSCGNILSSLKNLTRLTYLYLYGNEFSGQIPSLLGNVTQLIHLCLGDNQFWGPIPKSIFTSVNLERLDLYDNYLIGTIKVESFLNLKNLESLQLSGNKFSLLTTKVMNVTLPKFEILTLASCNLLEFPDFISGQDELEYLNLSGNNINGFIPKWIWGLSAQTLEVLDLSDNFLTDFNQPPVFPPWANLRILDLGSNKLQGSLPIPPASIYQYSVSNNMLKGEISSMICDLTSITVLELSNNSFSGMLPPCLGNLSKSLVVLNLQNNNFHGPILQTCEKGSELRMIDLSQNQLNGPMPRSLVNCKKLEILNLGKNYLEDMFSSWLGMLPELRILILRHNGFHGAIGKPKTNEFPKLQILDLSFNKLTGHLPSHHFQSWNDMKAVDDGKLRYLHANTDFKSINQWIVTFPYSMMMTKQGVETEYQKIQEFLVFIDLSSNRFEGCIPEDIQILKAIQFLNLSNNYLSGSIPSSLANLTELQSLDLSQNKLSGEIPQELVQLTFLGFFNVSNNQLTGTIPQSKQFATFENNSFGGNPGLCGTPLPKKCYPSPPTPEIKDEESGESWLEFGWKEILLGFGSGLVNGVVIGWYFFNPMKYKWVIKLFEPKLQNRRRDRN